MKKIFILLLLAITTIACESPKTDGDTINYAIVHHAYGTDTIQTEVCLVRSYPLRGVYEFYTNDSLVAVYPWTIGTQPPILILLR